MNNFDPVARVPIGQTNLISPYMLDQNKDAIIRPAEDFTVRITTISEQLYKKYKDNYKADKYHNDYFILLSQTGLGNQNKPNLRLHYVENIKLINQDILNLWAENVRTIEDYRDQKDGEGGYAGRLYLSFHSFCQDLGGSHLNNIKSVVDELINLTGLVAPTLVPYTSVASIALQGINNIISKFVNFTSELKSTGINLYPYTAKGDLPPGDAYLQTGSYILFFEPTEIAHLQLAPNGVVESSNNQPVNPYIVVNIIKGITLAPDKLDINVAQEILEKYQQDYGYPLPKDKQNNDYVDGLKQLGESYRWTKKVERYYQLKKKGDNRTPEELSKMNQLQQEIEAKFPNLEL